MRAAALVTAIAVQFALATSGGASRVVAAGEPAELAPYRQALATGSVGQVQGQVSAEARHPAGPAIPYADVSVLLVPFAPDVYVQLDQIKAHMRDSVSTYADAYSEIAILRESYEHQLLAAGGGELIRGEVSDPGGRFALSGVPEGEWLLLGWREDAHQTRTPKGGGRDSGKFADRPVSVGYGAVSYWRMRLTVRAGEITDIKLSDRSIWLTAVRDELVQRGSTERPPSKRRR